MNTSARSTVRSRRPLSTMQDFPLTITAILRHGRRVYADERVRHVDRRRRRGARPSPRSPTTPTGSRPRSRARRRERRPRRHVLLEHAGAPRGVPRDPVDGRGAAHAEHPAVPRAARVRRSTTPRTRSSSSTTRSSRCSRKVVDRAADRRALHRRRRRRRVARSATDATIAALRRAARRASAPSFDWPEIDERQAAAMCYTSGTTGNPKGVAYSHRSSYLHSLVGDHAGRARPLRARPRAHDRADVPRQRVGHPVRRVHVRRVARDAGPVPAGRAADAHDRRRSASRSRARCRRSGPTSSATARSTRSTCRRMRMIICGGSAVPRSLMERFEERYGVRIVQGWGMTETSPLAAVAHPPASVELGIDRGDGLARDAPAASSPASSCASSTTRATRCRGTARRSARSRCAARGSPASYYRDAVAREVRRRLAAHRRRRLGQRARATSRSPTGPRT